MIITRTVSDILYLPNGLPAAGVELIFSLSKPLAYSLDDTVLEQPILVTTGGDGSFTVDLWASADSLVPLQWELSLPADPITGVAGPKYQFGISQATVSPVSLRALLEENKHFQRYPPEYWAALKRAARLYSDYRPVLVKEVFSPVQDDTSLVVPENVIGVERVAGYGEQITFEEVMTADPLVVTGWHFYQGQMYLTAVQVLDPLVPPVVTVVWRKAHLPDEVAQTFPTIPIADLSILTSLAEADMEIARQIQADGLPNQVTIGGTTLRWADQRGIARAQALRNQALQQLDLPLSAWG